MPRITDVLHPDRVIFPAGTKGDILAALCRVATTDARSRRSLERAVAEREAMAPTTLGCGVAVPHGHIPELDRFVMAGAVLERDLDWDGYPVRFVFLIGAPEGQQMGFLKLLSTLTQLVDRPGFRSRLAVCREPGQVVRLFRDHPLSPPHEERRTP